MTNSYGFCVYHEIECDYKGLCIECPHNTKEDTEWFKEDEEKEKEQWENKTMTKQEAIEYGLRWKNAICDRGDTENSEAVQFLNMAIEALEQEPSNKRTIKHTETHACDCISRQAAIDEIARWIGYIDEDMILRVQTGLEKVPSAQPFTEEQIQTMQELEAAQPFTEELIQTMQELEAAQIEKAYELGKADRPTGHWIEKEVFDNQDSEVIDCYQSARCSHCGKYHTTPYSYSFDNYNFCPNCGADMRGGPTLTPEEFAEKMAGIAENGDEERKHVAADSIMCELLKSLGFGEGVGIFEDMDKWYS